MSCNFSFYGNRGHQKVHFFLFYKWEVPRHHRNMYQNQWKEWWWWWWWCTAIWPVWPAPLHWAGPRGHGARGGRGQHRRLRSDWLLDHRRKKSGKVTEPSWGELHGVTGGRLRSWGKFAWTWDDTLGLFTIPTTQAGLIRTETPSFTFLWSTMRVWVEMFEVLWEARQCSPPVGTSKRVVETVFLKEILKE